ncbi:MAG: hypothetical protein KDB01_00125 [Planctomycetaceae bacterium]|nr:hypothetical protein [Planctomycetaceae bacterium]
MKTSYLKDKRRALAFWAVLIAVLSVALYLLFHRQPPLSSLERQLEGEWYSDPKDPGYTTTYAADRTLSTSNGQFTGVWHINDGRLTVTYWQIFERPRGYTVADVAHCIRRIRKTTCSWDLTFADDGQQFTLRNGVYDATPNEQWLWYRVEH